MKITDQRVTTIFACPKCSKIYHHKKTLSRHIRQECGIEPELKCPHCPYRARRAYVLNNHIKGHQYLYNSTWVKGEQSEPIENLFTDFENDTENGWTIQVIYPEDSSNTLLSEKDIALSLDNDKEIGQVDESDIGITVAQDEQVISLQQMDEHEDPENSEIVQADVFTCPNCLKTYNAKRNLQRHLRVECGKEPQYGCKFCGYRNYRRNELLNHVKKRHGIEMLVVDRKK